MRKVFTTELFPVISRLDPSEIEDEKVKEWAERVRQWAENLVALLINARQPSATPVTIRTAAYTVTPDDDVLLCSGTWILTLPKSTDRERYYIRNTGSGTITIVGTNSETIDNASSYSLATGTGIIAIADGTGWWTI